MRRFFIFETYEFSRSTAEAITLVVIGCVLRNTCKRTSGIGIHYIYYVFLCYGHVKKHFQELVHGTLYMVREYLILAQVCVPELGTCC